MNGDPDLCLRTQEQRKHLEVAEQLLLVVDCLCGTAIAADGMGKSTQWAAAWAGKAKVYWGRRRWRWLQQRLVEVVAVVSAKAWV